MDRAVLDTALDRAPVNDDGRSGTVLGREVDLVRRAVLDGLPTTVLHPVIDAWYDDDVCGVLVMRDLGDAVLTWKSIVSRDQARTMFAAIADLHAAYLGSAPDALTPLDLLLGLFEPRRIRPYVGETIVDYALRGWEYWPARANVRRCRGGCARPSWPSRPASCERNL